MLRAVPWSISALLCLGLAICYAARPDACAAVTVFPAWAWLAPGLFLAAFNLRGRGKRAGWATCAGWLIFLASVAEEPWSLARGLLRPGLMPTEAGPPVGVVRVVSLNCDIGNRRAAEEVARYRPYVVLLQESPGRSEVEALARQLFGAEAGFVHGVDASLLARGRVVPAGLPASARGLYVQARVQLADGREIEVISTRLVPAIFRADLWSPNCWREQAQNRRARREQLRRIARQVESSPLPVVLGGDFNAPQGDAVFRLLRPRLRDAFADDGLDWGDTILNRVPVLRIDQIWVSNAIRARAVAARPTRNSDHRLVVCDLTWNPQLPGR